MSFYTIADRSLLIPLDYEFSSLEDAWEECQNRNGPDWVDVKALGLNRSIENAMYLPYELLVCRQPQEGVLGYFVDYVEGDIASPEDEPNDYFWDGYKIYFSYQEADDLRKKFIEGHRVEDLNGIGRYMIYGLKPAYDEETKI